MGFSITGTPAGKGMLDIPGLIERLSSTGEAPSGILELWPTPAESLKGTIAKERRWVIEVRTEPIVENELTAHFTKSKGVASVFEPAPHIGEGDGL